jgi:hypothetical protein
MFFGFDLFRDDSIRDLDERITQINNFLKTNLSKNGSDHRLFGAFLLPPGVNPQLPCFTYLAKRQSSTNFRLVLDFFDGTGSEPIEDLELIYDLGTTPEVYDSLKEDVSAISYLCAYPECEEITFIKSERSLSILFKFSDNDPNIKRIKNHVEFLIPSMSQSSI